MPKIIDNAGELLARYDVVFCDVWGVVHNGRTAYIEGCSALERFRHAGGTVILVSNAPRTPSVVADVLDEKNVPTDCWDAIVSSGGLALKYAAEQNITRVYHIGPDRDLDIFNGANLERVEPDDAEAILCTGLLDDRNETGEHYRERLASSVDRGLPLICANPDLIVDVGELQLPCAGAIAAVYEDMGGAVHWAGKPHAAAYVAAMDRAKQLRVGAMSKDRILAIGDAVRTDITGAAAFGIDALFIGQGIHRTQVMRAGELDEGALRELFSGDTPRATAAMATLRW